MLHERDDHEAAAVGQCAHLERHPGQGSDPADDGGDGRQRHEPGGSPGNARRPLAHRDLGDPQPEHQHQIRPDGGRRGPPEHVDHPSDPPGSARPSAQLAGSEPQRRAEGDGRDGGARAGRRAQIQPGGWRARKTAERPRMATSPGTMKHTHRPRARRPRRRQAQKMASWVDAGPGSRLMAAMPSSKSRAASQPGPSRQPAQEGDVGRGAAEAGDPERPTPGRSCPVTPVGRRLR